MKIPRIQRTVFAITLGTFSTIVALTLGFQFLKERETEGAALREDVGSRRAAVELQDCLKDLAILENNRVEEVKSLHERVENLIHRLGESANHPREREIYQRMMKAFDRYLKLWVSLPPRDTVDHTKARSEATAVLENELLKLTLEFERFNARRIENAAERHDRVVRENAWMLASFGVLIGIAGLAIGYVFTRSMSRRMSQIRFQLRDAAGKLGPQLPEIVVQGEGKEHFQSEVDHLCRRIEETVDALRKREYEILRSEQLAAVGRLAAGVAHEIRNPLTSLKLLVQASLQDQGGIQGEDLAVMEGEIRRVENLLNSFLDFTRPPKLIRRTVHIQEIIKEVLILVRVRLVNQRVECLVDSDDRPIQADGERLRQVFMNLILNALDAMPSGGKISIRAKSENGLCAIDVVDQGPGIAPEMLERLFEPFSGTKETGLGLGLVISRRVIEDHGGTIEVVNRPEGGAHFTIRLPVG